MFCQAKIGSFTIKIKLFYGSEKGTCAPNYLERAIEQMTETVDRKQICWMSEEIEGTSRMSQAVSRQRLKIITGGGLYIIGWSRVPCFDESDRKYKHAAYQIGRNLKRLTRWVGFAGVSKNSSMGNVTFPWCVVYTKTYFARNCMWTNDVRPIISSHRSYCWCWRAFIGRVASFWRCSVRLMSFGRCGDTAWTAHSKIGRTGQRSRGMNAFFVITTNPWHICKRRARDCDMVSLASRYGLKLAARETPISHAHSALLISASPFSESWAAGCWQIERWTHLSALSRCV